MRRVGGDHGEARRVGYHQGRRFRGAKVGRAYDEFGFRVRGLLDRLLRGWGFRCVGFFRSRGRRALK